MLKLDNSSMFNIVPRKDGFMKNKLKKFTLLAGTFCAGVLAGFIIRSSESADYNTGYNPAKTEFNDSDYFTPEAIEELEKKKKARHARKEKESAE